MLLHDKKLIPLILSLLLLACSSWFILASNAAGEETYELGCSLSFSPSSPHQTETMIISVEIENLGDTPFTGQATLDAETDQHSFEPEIIEINSLAAGETQQNDVSYRVDDEGIFWATLTIEQEESANIRLYVGSDVEDEASSVEFTDSVFVMSLATFNQQQAIMWTEIGVITSVVVASLTVINMRVRRKKRKNVMTEEAK